MARSFCALAVRDAIGAGSARCERLSAALPVLLALLLFAVGCEQTGQPVLSRATSSVTSGTARVVTAGRGDSVSLIAKRYAVSMHELIEVNQLLPPYRLEVGQQLRLPTNRTYTVSPGDTLSKLA
ncbi:MAG: LysM domain-containing protein, partial [Rhodospirillaceae bacterium]